MIWYGMVRYDKISATALGATACVGRHQTVGHSLQSLQSVSYSLQSTVCSLHFTVYNKNNQLGGPSPDPFLPRPGHRPPQNLKNHWHFICFSTVFWKSLFRNWHRFLIRSWCQHASIFLPKMNQKWIKIATWKASIFWWIFASIFYRFSFDLGRQLGAMLGP